ncbi:MAG: DUF4440 domain-containing protein [Bacteroidetes bacterium]|nr:DUF4440 domain-containing protein [Bacteroidota bacterium]
MRLFLFCLLAFPLTLSAQSDTQQIKAAINEMFDGMRAADTSRIAAVFTPDAQLIRVGKDREGVLRTRSSSVQDFLNGLASAEGAYLDEKLWSFDIRVDPPLATAWTDYAFYLNEELHHCGINTFTLYQTAEGWKISRVEDTGYPPEKCTMTATSNEEAINLLLDNYHKAAAEADEDTFFGSMTADGMYLGTDASERWLRDELKAWSAKYFERDTAWDFTPTQRHVYISDDGTTAWFDELLDTWMGTCRGSGVLQKTEAGWKIKQYNLTMMIPNDEVQGVIEVLKGGE